MSGTCEGRSVVNWVSCDGLKRRRGVHSVRFLVCKYSRTSTKGQLSTKACAQLPK